MNINKYFLECINENHQVFIDILHSDNFNTLTPIFKKVSEDVYNNIVLKKLNYNNRDVDIGNITNTIESSNDLFDFSFEFEFGFVLDYLKKTDNTYALINKEIFMNKVYDSIFDNYSIDGVMNLNHHYKLNNSTLINNDHGYKELDLNLLNNCSLLMSESRKEFVRHVYFLNSIPQEDKDLAYKEIEDQYIKSFTQDNRKQQFKI